MKTLILFSSLFILSFSAHAEVYKWTDADGKVRYGDRKPVNKEADILDVVVDKPTPLKPEEKLIMYSSSWSIHCKDAREYFTSKKIPFIEYDIEQDTEANKRYTELGGKGVPLIQYKGKDMTGFSVEHFEEFYK